VSEEIYVRLPEDSIEAEDDFVEIPEAETLDGRAFPLWQRRIEADGVGLTRLLLDGYLQNAECQC
jgi:hypothetical protein